MPKVPVSEALAGPALDAAVAQVLGWNDPAFEAYGRNGYHDDGRRIVPRWSANITRALELGPENGYTVSIEYPNWSECEWHLPNDDGIFGFKMISAKGETLALARTRVFLLAHGVEEIEVPDEAA